MHYQLNESTFQEIVNTLVFYTVFPSLAIYATGIPSSDSSAEFDHLVSLSVVLLVSVAD